MDVFAVCCRHTTMQLTVAYLNKADYTKLQILYKGTSMIIPGKQNKKVGVAINLYSVQESGCGYASLQESGCGYQSLQFARKLNECCVHFPQDTSATYQPGHSSTTAPAKAWACVVINPHQQLYFGNFPPRMHDFHTIIYIG